MNRKALTALLLAAIFVFALSFTAAFAGHDCDGIGCGICAALTHINAGLGLITASALFIVYKSERAAARLSDIICILYCSLITLKVKLTD